jgi:hypothetical protein
MPVRLLSENILSGQAFLRIAVGLRDRRFPVVSERKIHFSFFPARG